mgnify:CR=1 FL=1
MIKKILKFLFVTGMVLVILAGVGLLTLYKMYPPAKLKMMAQEYVAQNFQRELTFDDISFTWIGFTLTNASLSENTTFQNGTFIHADKLTAHVAVKPLFQKRIEISTIEADGLQVNLMKRKDGRFNFDTLFPTQETAQPETPAQPEDSAATPFVLTAENIQLADCDIVYQDEQTGLRAAVNDLNITVEQFDLAAPFNVRISFTNTLSLWGQPDITVPVQLSLHTFLADLNLADAYVTVTDASARYQTVQFKLNGDIKNLENPSVNLSGMLTGVSNQVFNAFAPDLPHFTLPALALSLQARADLENSVATITQAKLSVQDSSLSASGTVNWGQATPAYQLAASLKANIAQLVQMTDTLDGFSPSGILSGQFKATEKKNYTDVSGTLTLTDVSALYQPFTLTKTNGTVKIVSLEDISSARLTGQLNGQNFTASFSYKNVKDVMNLVLGLDLEKLFLKEFPASQSTTEGANQTADADSQPSATPVRLNVQAQVNIGGIDIPYLQSDGLVLSAQLTDITDTLAKTNGTISFSFKPGKITNLDNFIKDSKIAKIILLPVAVVKKVASILQLNLFPTDESGQGTTVSFTEGTGQYTFTNGVMNLDKTVFNSSVTRISASGTADFQTEQLNMKATATLLTQAAPVAIKITGSFSEPKGKLDVVNTVTSVVGGLLNGTAVKSVAKTGAEATSDTAHFATDTVKTTVNTAADIIKGVGGLFKKKTDTDK